jgi:hypothetical protein
MAFIPIGIGLALYVKNKNITWQEWIIGSVAALLTAGIFQYIAISGMTADVETWSGEITATSRYGAWTERYRQSHTRTVGSGKNQRTETYYTTEYDYHPEHWTVTRSFGNGHEDTKSVDEDTYKEIFANFGSQINETETQGAHHFGGTKSSGDNRIYITYNNTSYDYPVTKQVSFENRVKAAPSLFSFPKVPTNITVFEWPKNEDWMSSGRLLGTAAERIPIRTLDLMNTRIGFRKKVNVIIVGFDKNAPNDYGHWQEAAWIGGKKNDLVLCFKEGEGKLAASSYVFGWTESEYCKKNLQTLLITHPINKDIIPLIEKEIVTSYKVKDWSKFDYITVEPPRWSYIVYIFVIFGTQTGLYVYFHRNEYTQTNREYNYRNRYRY